MTTCKACGAEIVFCCTTDGKIAPFDASPHEEGTYLVHRGRAAHAGPGLLPAVKFLGLPLYRSHFATCPDASRFRRGADATDRA